MNGSQLQRTSCHFLNIPHIGCMNRRSAFTLIELLTVIAIIAILAGITYGISAGIYQRQARTTAQAELSAISSALEAYRSQYGMYPIADTGNAVARGRVLFQALTNQIDPEGNDPRRGRPFIDISKVTLSTPETGTDFSSVNYFVDPWGNPYQYGFENDPSQAEWRRFGYLLFSDGPDGRNEEDGIPEDGLPDREAPLNRDNIYAN